MCGNVVLYLLPPSSVVEAGAGLTKLKSETMVVLMDRVTAG